MLGVGEILETVDAQVAQLDPGAEQIARRLRDDDLAARRRARDSRGPVDVEADVAVLGDERLSGMDPDAELHRATSQAVTDRDGCRHRISGPRERGEEGVPLRVHLDTVVGYQGSADDSPVAEDPSSSTFSQKNREMSVLAEMLTRPIAELELSVRARNCLDGANIQTWRDLVSLSENEVMNLKNLGKTSLTEIKSKLSEHGLTLGMEL